MFAGSLRGLSCVGRLKGPVSSCTLGKTARGISAHARIRTCVAAPIATPLCASALLQAPFWSIYSREWAVCSAREAETGTSAEAPVDLSASREEETPPPPTEEESTEDGPDPIEEPPPLGTRESLKVLYGLIDWGLLLLGVALTLFAVGIAIVVPARCPCVMHPSHLPAFLYLIPTHVRSAALLKAAAAGQFTTNALINVLLAANASAVFKMSGSYCLLAVGDRLKRRLRAKVFTAVLAQEIDYVFQHRPATLVAGLVADTDLVQRAVSHHLGMGLASLAAVVGGLAQLALISPQLTLLTMSVAPPIAIAASMCARYERGMRRRTQAASEQATSCAGEALAQVVTVQAYAQEDQEAQKYASLQKVEGALERSQLLFHKLWTTMLQAPFPTASYAAGTLLHCTPTAPHPHNSNPTHPNPPPKRRDETRRHGTTRHDTARHGTARHGTALHGMARHGRAGHTTT